MLKTTFTLIAKKQLTHDVFELVYECPDIVKDMPRPGQYVMFQLAPGLNRAYSFASYTDSTFTLIIKRISEGKWSPLICDADTGSIFSGIISLGHFVLNDTDVRKCFIGTGTGFAPLYAMVLHMRARESFTNSHIFLYGVKSVQDAFYDLEMKELHESGILDFRQYFSADSQSYATTGYVTSWITPENVRDFQEFYICGSPAMVKDARDKLEALGILKENIYFEQY